MKQRHYIFLGIVGAWLAGVTAYSMTTSLGQTQGVFETLGNVVALLWIPALLFYGSMFVYDRLKPKQVKTV